MRVLLVEDDHPQAKSIAEALRRSFHDVEVRHICTESQFMEQFASIRQEPPDVVLLDVMLRWADPAPSTPEPPDEIRKGGFYRAGLRCLGKLCNTKETHEIPVIVYTVLAREDVKEEIEKAPPHVLFLQKDSDERRMIRHIRSLLQGLPESNMESRSWQRRLWESVEVKRGWMGFSMDLKNLLKRNRKHEDRHNHYAS
jgi:CheY-like chemotaxis protein